MAYDLVSANVHDEVGVAQRLIRVCVTAPQESTHPRHQFLIGERLDQVVIGARVQAANPVADPIQGCEHEDRHVARGAQSLGDLDAVDSGKKQVEHNQIQGPCGGLVQCGAAILRDIHDVSFVRQGPMDRRCDPAVVVYHQNPSLSDHVLTESRRRMRNT